MPNNIEDRMDLFFEFWELANKASILIGIILSLNESFKDKLQKGMSFKEISVEDFIRKLIDMND